MSEKYLVYIGIGSNLGDRNANIARAVGLLDGILEDCAVSSIMESPAIDRDGQPDPDSPDYLNAAVKGEYDGPLETLLAILQRLERTMGRNPDEKSRYLPRIIDLDILYVLQDGIPVVTTAPDLVIPHPRIKDRPFVIGPLRELGLDSEILA